jgi:hypothetical protein
MIESFFSYFNLTESKFIQYFDRKKFVENLGEPGMFPEEDAKLEILQGILLDSATFAFNSVPVGITLDTSITEIKKQNPIGFRLMDSLLGSAALRVQEYGCTLSIDQNLGFKIYMEGIKSPSNVSGKFSTINDLLPVLNSRISCP